MIGSRDAERGAGAARSSSASQGGANEDVVRGADLAVLADEVERARSTPPASSRARSARRRCSASRATCASPRRRPARARRRARSPRGLAGWSRARRRGPALARGATSAARSRPTRTRSSAATTRRRRGSRSSSPGGSSPAARSTRAARERARARGHDRGDPEREPRYGVARGHPRHRPAVIAIRPGRGPAGDRARATTSRALIAERAELEDGDVVVVAQKVVSKAEGRVVRLEEVEPSGGRASSPATSDPRRIEVILRESARIVRSAPAARDRRDAARLRLRLGRRRRLERARGGHGRAAARSTPTPRRRACATRCGS